jgi:hypothetical protein
MAVDDTPESDKLPAVKQGRASIRIAAALAAMLALGAATPAFARDVYLNGLKLDSSVVITSQTFPSCEVQIDARGDVYITAKGFKIETKPSANEAAPAPAPTAPPPAASVAAVSKRYWLVSKQPRKGLAQYDVDVYLNGKFVKKVRAQDDPVILDVTRAVRSGANEVKLVATKNMGDKRLSASPTDTLEIILGEGSVGGGTVSITRTVVTYVRNAQETKSFSDDARFDAR